MCAWCVVWEGEWVSVSVFVCICVCLSTCFKIRLKVIRYLMVLCNIYEDVCKSFEVIDGTGKIFYICFNIMVGILGNVYDSKISNRVVTSKTA